MILNKVKLEDFISHKKTEIELSYGINVIVGPNGAGKTSVLDGVSFALFNDSCRGKKENIINSKANRCKVSLEFTEAGVGYEVDWSMERGSPAKGNLFRIVDGKRSLLVRGGERSVVPEVSKVLGIDKNMFLQSVYVRQGEIEKLVTALPGARKELISRLLGVEDLERAWNGIKGVIQVYRDEQTTLGAKLERRPDVEKQKNEAEAKSKQLAALLVSKRKDLADVKTYLNRLQADLADFKCKKREFDALDKEKGILDQTISGLQIRLGTEKAELAKTKVAEAIVKELEGEVSLLPALEAYVQGLGEKEKLELKLSAFETKLGEITELKATLEKNAQNHVLYLEKGSLLVKKGKERRKYEGADSALEAANKQLVKLRNQQKKKAENLTMELKRYSEVLGEYVSVENVEAVVNRVGSDLQAKVKAFDEKSKQITSEIGILVQRTEEWDESLIKFSNATETQSCPTCETELGPERVSQLVKKYSLEKSNATREVASLRGGLKQVEEERKQTYQKSRETDALDAKRIQDLAVESKEVGDAVLGQELEIEETKKQVEALKAFDALMEQLENEKSACEEEAKEFEAAEKRLGKLPSTENILAEQVPIAKALKEVLVLLRESKSKIGYEPKEPGKELRALREKKQQYDQNAPIAARKMEYSQNVAATEGEGAKARERLAALLGAIEKLDYDENKHNDFEQKILVKDKVKQEFERGIVRSEQEKLGLDQEVASCLKELEGLEEKFAQKKLVDKFIVVLNRIRDAFGKDGIQKMIRSRARPLLERSTRDLFERFNLAYSDIKIDDDYNISVLGSAGEQDIDQISGGERVALAIALRLAIAQVLSGKIETIIMDEPTTHLDEQRRKELVNILSSFFREGGRIIPQMLIITHHPEIEDAADTIYTIRKEDSYSIAEKNTLSHYQQ